MVQEVRRNGLRAAKTFNYVHTEYKNATMATCSYKTTSHPVEEEWECPLEALPGEEFCYWHKEEDGKAPTEDQIKELTETGIFGIYLKDVDLREANLRESNLQRANLRGAKLQEAYLGFAKLQKAILFRAELQEAYLGRANLREANLRDATLNAANLYNARFDLETRLEDCNLIDANLYRAYIDETKSFRYVMLPETYKEINEIVGDNLGKKTNVSKKKSRFALLLKPSVLNVRVLEKFEDEKLVRYAGEDDKVIFFDRSSGCAIRKPENRWRHKADLVEIDELRNLIVDEDDRIKPEFIYSKTRADLYGFSYEVYNTLYNFYKSNGRLDQAAAVHYRRGEVNRKWLREKGWFNWLRSWILDFLVLRLLTGYGDRIKRPFGASVTGIAVFALLFWWTDGIVKTVNGEIVTPGWLDYFYHSITTFTSLGYSNIQPNLAVGPLPQILVAAESVIGILLMALIIFVVTYHVSR